MKFTSQIVASASGSVGGCTYSRNRYGPYIRNRSVPVNPATSFQQTVRNLLATFTARWPTLIQSIRDAWDTYALLTPTTDSLGNAITLTGLNMYLRAQVFRTQLTGLGASDQAPTTPGLPSLTTPIATTDVSSGISVAFTNTDTWATAVGGALGIYQSRAQSPARQFFKGPYRLVGRVLGAVVPPTSPVIFATYPFPYAAGQRVHYQFRATDTQARVGSALRQSTIAVA